jgi:predicted hydrolase (HD superfamily)
MINREEAILLLRKYLRDDENIKHSLAVEAVVREIAKILDRNEELWGLTGLLHNIDYEYTFNEPEKRGILSAQLLEDLLPEDAVNAIKANNYMHTDCFPTTPLDKSLIAVDEAVRLVIDIAHSIPSNRIADLDLNTIIDKFNDQSFITRYNKSRIQLCKDVGIELKFFFKLLLDTLKSLSNELKL